MFILKNLRGKTVEAMEYMLRLELQRLEQEVLKQARAQLYTAAPINPQEGDIVRADGTSWDPGSGAGFYGYHGGAWTFLG